MFGRSSMAHAQLTLDTALTSNMLINKLIRFLWRAPYPKEPTPRGVGEDPAPSRPPLPGMRPVGSFEGAIAPTDRPNNSLIGSLVSVLAPVKTGAKPLAHRAFNNVAR